MTQRVVITGLGVVSSIGWEIDEFWSNLTAGRSGISHLSLTTSDLPVRIGGQISDFPAGSWFSPKESIRMDRFTQFALAAALQAAKDAKVEQGGEDVGVVVGSGVGGIITLLDQQQVLLEKGAGRVSPFMIPMMMINNAASQIAIRFHAQGYSSCPVTACASSLHALGEAYQVIRRGEARLIFAGGAEAPLVPVAIAAFANMKALSASKREPAQVSRPFDRNRDGFVISEGAGILVLEALESALARSAHIYGEIRGFAASTDAYHVAAPEPEGTAIVSMIKRALTSAGMIPEDIDYVNAHGTSTPLNDKIETLALHKAFNSHAKRLLVNSTKSMIGHLLGAAGAVETIAALLALERGIVHPTINLDEPDPDCDLDYVANRPRFQPIHSFLKLSYGFGGHNAGLIVSRYQG